MRKKCLDEKNDVCRFYLNDENSVAAPAARDFIKKNNMRMRKRFLSDSINNLHKKYCKESGRTISKSSFYRLRPFWVVEQRMSARDTCLCKEHEILNF